MSESLESIKRFYAPMDAPLPDRKEKVGLLEGTFLVELRMGRS
jgi:hypothetical protein